MSSEEKEAVRKANNRAAAKRSRVKKDNDMQGLKDTVDQLERNNRRLEKGLVWHERNIRRLTSMVGDFVARDNEVIDNYGRMVNFSASDLADGQQREVFVEKLQEALSVSAVGALQARENLFAALRVIPPVSASCSPMAPGPA